MRYILIVVFSLILVVSLVLTISCLKDAVYLSKNKRCNFIVAFFADAWEVISVLFLSFCFLLISIIAL